MIDLSEGGDKQFRASAMNSAQVTASSEKTYLLAHQNVCLTTIDFANRRIVGYTELLFVPLKLNKITTVKLNAKQCQIIKLLAKGSTEFYNCTFTYNDPVQEVVLVEPQPAPPQEGDQLQLTIAGTEKTLKKFSSRHHDAVTNTELDLDGGEIIITLPPEVLKEISDGSTFKLLIEYSIEQPQGGLHFVVPDEDLEPQAAPSSGPDASDGQSNGQDTATGSEQQPEKAPTPPSTIADATTTEPVTLPNNTTATDETDSVSKDPEQNDESLEDNEQSQQEGDTTTANPTNGLSPAGSSSSSKDSSSSDDDDVLMTNGEHHIKIDIPEPPTKKKSKYAHLYSYKNHNSSRLWFPCLDSYGQPCTWLLEFTVDSHMTVVSCGDSIGVCTTPDKRFKVFRFELNTPTAAPNIGFACGSFDVWTSPATANFTCPVKNYYLTGLDRLVEASCSFVPDCAEFYEDFLTFKYPYSNYKQVFVDEAYEPCQSYATLSICCLNLLHSKHIIDQTFETRSVLSDALAAQFFGCFISMSSWSAAWLTRGISLFVAAQFKRKIFGNNDYRFNIQETMKKLIEYEQKHGGIVLDESSGIANKCKNNFHFSTQCPHTLSPLYNETHRLKSLLVIRMLEDRIGKTLLVQVFNKILSLASSASIQPASVGMWGNMLLSTVNFERAVFAVTGKDKEIASFLEHWIYQGGHAKFNGSFTFDRKRNVVELHIRQPDTGSTGIRPYFGSITVTVQELDGTFLQKLNIEENKTSPFVITCHSKSRRNKKKKIPLCTGEEVDMDLSMMDSHDSPVLWIRIDPDMQILRQVVFEQPDFNWQYQLKYERDITAQLDSLQVLMNYPTVATRKTMMEIIEDERCFYRVRCKAALNLTKIANDMAITTTSGGWQAPTSMINIFKRLFGSHSCPHIIRLNNFSPTNLQSYFLQKTVPKALAGLRVPPHRICPPEVLKFLLDLLKYNDNSKNSFSDNYYRAALIEALAETVTPVVVSLFNSSMQSTTVDQVPSETKLVAEEITRCLNMEKILPCYKYVVTCACLKAIQQLQRMGHLPSNSALFRSYTSEHLFFDVRCAAVVQLVEIIRAEHSHSDLDFLLGLVEGDRVPAFKYFILAQLHRNPPISLNAYPNYSQIKERLWAMMNSDFAHDSKLRCASADVFHRFFGKSSQSSGAAGDPNHKAKKKKKKKDKDKDKEKKKSKKTKDGMSSFLSKMSH